MNEQYRPRLNVEIRQDQFDALQEHLDFGLKKIVFEPVIDEIISMLKADKPTFIAACISRIPVLGGFKKK